MEEICVIALSWFLNTFIFATNDGFLPKVKLSKRNSRILFFRHPQNGVCLYSIIFQVLFYVSMIIALIARILTKVSQDIVLRWTVIIIGGSIIIVTVVALITYFIIWAKGKFSKT